VAKSGKAYEEIEIGSWERFHEVVLSSRYANWAFRGQSDANWPLDSTLRRRLRTTRINPEAWIDQESRVIRIFQRKAHLFLEHIPTEDDTFQWLAIMQHHGAPTRLLDFTWSPYVAAFFALENAAGDSAIWAASPPALSRPLQWTSARKQMNPEEIGPWDKGNFEKYFLPNKRNFIVYGEPRIMNQRLISQSGTFIIPSTLARPVEDIVSTYPRPKDVLVKFILKTRNIRERAMLELYTMNVTYYSLFPGLDGLGRSMGYECEYSWSRNLHTLQPLPGYEE